MKDGTSGLVGSSLASLPPGWDNSEICSILLQRTPAGTEPSCLQQSSTAYIGFLPFLSLILSLMWFLLLWFLGPSPRKTTGTKFLCQVGKVPPVPWHPLKYPMFGFRMSSNLYL